MKNIIKVLVGLALMVYIGFAIVKWSKTEETGVCNRLDVVIVDSLKNTFLSENDVKELLERKKMNPVGMPLKQIKLNDVETKLEAHPFILNAECYKTPDGTLCVKVTPRFPVLRVLSNNGGNFYIDANGEEMKNSSFSADVVVATGDISPKYAKRYLAKIGNFLQADEFWNSQIEQLNVQKDGSIQMVPRIGDHIVNLGAPTDIEKKLERLKLFYTKALSKVGWNKYETIDLQYNNQIVCTKAN